MHQKKLADAKAEEGRLRFASGGDMSKTVQKAKFRKYECFRKEDMLPRATENLKVRVYFFCFFK